MDDADLNQRGLVALACRPNRLAQPALAQWIDLNHDASLVIGRSPIAGECEQRYAEIPCRP